MVLTRKAFDKCEGKLKKQRNIEYKRDEVPSYGLVDNDIIRRIFIVEDRK